ncbi:MAG TPA: toll/interleukin-1 receptor domain-containing protein, partial [Blastocatellia bacterium]|nr:toll/interleukin-1 receptor domain-containing protein [Blastocatellia bacterium]
MSYLPGFDYDIFISYAHVDNETAYESEVGWVTQFREHLEVQLSKRIGRIGAVKIWQDPSLEGSQLFDKTIQDGINRSALFLALTSTGYLMSDYCRQELQWFTKKANAEPTGITVGDRMRVFNLLLNNVAYTDWPEEYGRTSGFPFHDAERDDEFGYPSDPKDRLFQQQMRKLVDSIYKTLCLLKEKLEEKARPAFEKAG